MDVDEFSDTGATALHTACDHDSIEVANYLIHKGADIKYIGGSKNIPLDVYAQARLRKSLSARGLNIPFDSDDEETKITDEKIETLSSLDSRHHQQIDQMDILGSEKPSSARKVMFTSDSHYVPIKDKLKDEKENLGCEKHMTDQSGELLTYDGKKMNSSMTTTAASPSTSAKFNNAVDEELRNIFCQTGSVTQLKAVLQENTSIDLTNTKFVSKEL